MGLLAASWMKFERVIKLLKEFPDIGKSTGEDRRSFPLTGFPYPVIYRHVNAEIRVLGVRHQNRDPEHGEQRS